MVPFVRPLSVTPALAVQSTLVSEAPPGEAVIL